MKKNYLILAMVFFSIIHGCASDEQRVKKKTYFGGERIDISQLNYFELTTGKEISLDKYMESNDLDHVFLIFGSVGCVKCNAKAKKLSHDLMGKHSLFLESKALKFELIGVNTDVGNARKRFDMIWGDESVKKEVGYDFIRWSDPGAASVKAQLLDEGSTFAIPFMVLLNRSSLLARYKANDQREIDVILDDVLAVLQGKVPQEPTPSVNNGGGEDPEPVPSENPTVKFDQTVLTLPTRFNELKGWNCASGKPSTLEKAFAKGRRYIHIGTETCDQSCTENRKLFETSLQKYCEGGGKCSVADYVLSSEAGDACSSDIGFVSTVNLRDQFKTAFNWRENLVNFSIWGEPESLDADQSSYVLVFDSRNNLIFAKSGTVKMSDLTGFKPASKDDHLPEFKLFGAKGIDQPTQVFTLRDIVAANKYTVFYEYGPGCESCDKKLQKWSKISEDHPGMNQFCSNNKGFCSVYALNLPLFGVHTPESAYVDTRKHMVSLDIDVPLLVDQDTIQRDAQSDPFSRFFEGYLKPSFNSEWQDSFGFVLNGATVIYDSEGKIVASFAPSNDPNAKDMVSEAIHSLWLYHQRR